MRILLYFFLVVSVASGCSDVESVENKDDNGVLLEKYERKKDNLAKHGKYTAFHSNGQVFEERFYQNDLLEGESRIYYENGKLDYIENHVKGEYVGMYKKYYENGQLSNEGQYVDNQMNGLWKRWYDNGQLREEVPFVGNEENGHFKEYHENGKIKTEGAYINGDHEQGELRIYDINGTLTEKMICEYGVCGTTWRKEEGDLEIDLERIKKLGGIKKIKIEEEPNNE